MEELPKNGDNRGSCERCEGTKSDGSACQAMVLEGENFCFFHHPAKAEERRAAQRRGGEGNRAPVLPADSSDSDFVLKNDDDVLRFVTVVINRVYAGHMEPKRATALGFLAGIAQKALASRNFEARLATLESMLKPPPAKGGLFDPNGGENP